ncbi:hypothetical protein [Chromobacterium paludis]|uniref:Uncharacterized protein n=1 Tax=Chromobacterium paludis TaxID=2605945 RepID=A0A5C1DCB4_9NEIS|nr:hypothetical protein [Chromobacterium paludis]QEL54220.1 hypothetical protein FYK34_00800 [Chromobacterium paludis]
MNGKSPLILCATLALAMLMAVALRDAPLSLACHVGRSGMHVAANLAVLRMELHFSWLPGAAA